MIHNDISLPKMDSDFITANKLKIFEKYKKNGSGYDRVGRKDSDILRYDQFLFIERLIQDLKLINKGLAADNYEQHINGVLQEQCDSEETIRLLKDLASKY